ncbi:prospero homeobox protein 2 [Oxyura jamaicensis]|uniref:prospero homeobox protein 2 n=1 Tax=Oxyura jamaicensis TaxID=8884 RepID=UPI0015A689D6|nr:prospero homeobox protein 2 [Oxyura jamaicensis]
MIPYQLQGTPPVSRRKDDPTDGRRAPEQDRHPAASGHGRGLKTEPCFHRDPLLSSPSVSLVSQLLSHTVVSRSLDPCTVFPSSRPVGLPQGYELGAPPGEGAQALALTRTRALAPVPCAGDRELLSDEHLRAKRARVESIIQGMSLPPTPQAPDTGMEGGLGQDREKGTEMSWEGKRKPRVSQPQRGAGVAGRGAPSGGSPHAAGCQQLKEQLCFLEQQLRWLQERFSQVCDPGDAAQTQGGAEKAQPLAGKAGDRPDRDGAAAARHPHKAAPWGSTPEADGPDGTQEDEGRGDAGGLPSAARVISQALKHELAGVTSRVVDSVLTSMWPKAAGHLLQQHPGPGAGARGDHFPAGKCRKPLAKSSPMGTLCSPPPEAPSLPSGKSLSPHTSSFSPRVVRNPHQAPSVGYTLGSAVPSAQEGRLLGQLLGYGHWGSPPAPQKCPPEAPDPHWGATRLRPSAVRQQRCPLPLGPGEEDGDGAPFAPTHEALTPGHLKKAKLMFFFTRYPSSTLLRSYFLDVQFSRCITSQLIKWFSNFREFYYIQVEKFARQALLEGVADAGALRVSRDSELFRALNTHYNKGNDFQVPGRFLEVASLTLQEFFSAVRAGKDADPSWKKPIYKIISKLDSHIPDVFKAVGCSQELLRS